MFIITFFSFFLISPHLLQCGVSHNLQYQRLFKVPLQSGTEQFLINVLFFTSCLLVVPASVKFGLSSKI